MDGTKGAEEKLAPTFVEVHDTIVKRHFHGFVVTLTECFDHVAEGLIAVGKAFTHSAKDGSIGVAEVFAENVKIIICIAHDEFHLVAYILIVVFGDNVFDKSQTLFDFFNHCGLEVKHGEELLKHTCKFTAFAAFALFKLAAELGGYGDEVKHVTPINVFVYVVHCRRDFPFSTPQGGGR